MSAPIRADGPVVVIGGGVAGLATAALLATDGREVTLVEARDELGGRVGSWESEGFRFDTGPSWYLMPEVFEHFFRLLGTTTAEQYRVQRLDPGYRVFFEGHADHLDIATDRAENERRFEALEPGAGAALAAYLDSASEVYRTSVDRFLYSTFAGPGQFLDPELLRAAPRLAGLLATSLERFVADRFDDNRLRQVLGYPAVFLGASPSLAPAIYHLMSAMDLGGQGVDYPVGGFVEFVAALERLARAAGVDIRTGTRALQIETIAARRSLDEPRPRRATAVLVECDGERYRLPAGLVVTAADLHHTETRLLSPAARSIPEPRWQRRTPGPGAVLALLGVRGRLPKLLHHNLYFTRDWGENFDRIFRAPTSVPDPASMYVCMPSATDATVAPEGDENLFVLVPVPADPGIGRGGFDGDGSPEVEAAADRALARLASLAEAPDLAERVVVRRTIGPADFAEQYNAWRGTALGPAHTLRQSAMLRGSNRSAKVANLLSAGSTTVPGVGLPMCLISAELVLKQLRGDTSAGPLPEPLAASGAAAAALAAGRA